MKKKSTKGNRRLKDKNGHDVPAKRIQQIDKTQPAGNMLIGRLILRYELTFNAHTASELFLRFKFNQIAAARNTDNNNKKKSRNLCSFHLGCSVVKFGNKITSVDKD